LHPLPHVPCTHTVHIGDAVFHQVVYINTIPSILYSLNRFGAKLLIGAGPGGTAHAVSGHS
jgi:hypothetical protein